MAKSTTEEKSYTQYAVVVKGDMSLLVEEVNNLLSRGWNVIGGISVLQNGTTVFHYQSVVK
jgi:hypothetical protein